MLAGGLGTRLRTAVPDVPKPLASVGGRPFLSYLVERWVTQGISRIVFLIYHQADTVEAFSRSLAADAALEGCEFLTATEPTPLGTGGAVANAIRQTRSTESFLVANGDTWLDSGIRSIADASPPAIGVVRVPNTRRYGMVRVEGGVVAAFEEKAPDSAGGLINSGLYHLNADLFSDWKGEPFSLERDLFPKLVAEKKLTAIVLESDFVDIGLPEDYYRYCRWIESGKVGVP